MDWCIGQVEYLWCGHCICFGQSMELCFCGACGDLWESCGGGAGRKWLLEESRRNKRARKKQKKAIRRSLFYSNCPQRKAACLTAIKVAEKAAARVTKNHDQSISWSLKTIKILKNSLNSNLSAIKATLEALIQHLATLHVNRLIQVQTEVFWDPMLCHECQWWEGTQRMFQRPL